MISRELQVPLYLQVKEDLIQQIQTGRYETGDVIPSQKKLAEIYGISEITVRKALDLLVNEGYLHRIQGKGTFVAERKINRMLNLMSFTEEMRSRGLETTSQVLELGLIKDKQIAKELKILPTRGIVKIKRLRLIDGKPHALQSSFIPESVVSLEQMQQVYKYHSLYEILKKIDIEPFKAHEIYRADVLNNERLCRLLGVERGGPVLIVERYTYTKDDVLFEYVRSVLKGDIYTIEVVLTK